MRRGEIYLADMGKPSGHEQAGLRPVVIVSNNVGNTFSPNVIVATMTTKMKKNKLPTHVYVISDEIKNLKQNSIIQLENIKTIDKRRIYSDVLGHLSEKTMEKVDKALRISLSI